jgi:hypothetical protein
MGDLLDPASASIGFKPMRFITKFELSAILDAPMDI